MGLEPNYTNIRAIVVLVKGARETFLTDLGQRKENATEILGAEVKYLHPDFLSLGQYQEDGC